MDGPGGQYLLVINPMPSRQGKQGEFLSPWSSLLLPLSLDEEAYCQERASSNAWSIAPIRIGRKNGLSTYSLNPQARKCSR